MVLLFHSQATTHLDLPLNVLRLGVLQTRHLKDSCGRPGRRNNHSNRPTKMRPGRSRRQPKSDMAAREGFYVVAYQAATARKAVMVPVTRELLRAYALRDDLCPGQLSIL